MKRLESEIRSLFEAEKARHKSKRITSSLDSLCREIEQMIRKKKEDDISQLKTYIGMILSEIISENKENTCAARYDPALAASLAVLEILGFQASVTEAGELAIKES